MAVKINFFRTNVDEISGCIFESQRVKYIIDNIKYTWIFQILNKPSKYKMHTRIKKIRINDQQKKCLSQEINNYFIPLLWKIENAYIAKKLKWAQKEKNICDEYEMTLKMDLDSKALWVPYSLNNLSSENIKAIIKNTSKENLNSFFHNITLEKIKKFRDDWKKSIENKGKEKSFQTLLKENQELLIFLFPRIGNTLNAEYKIGNDNFADLVSIDKNLTIIELKRPDTKIFATSSIKNIVGISKELITAIIQLSLYSKKILHNLSKEEIISTEVYGILIYGDDDQFKSEKPEEEKEKKNAWTLFKETVRYQIYTFSEITERLNKIIKLLEKYPQGKQH